jgi:hypothetical protein
MAFTHGKNTYISINSVDLSAFCNTSTFTRGADSHDTTTYGKNDHCYSGGLGNNTFSCGGIYDNGSSGPRDTLEPLVGTVVTLVRRVEGTGSGLPSDSVSILVTSYVETSPVADMVSWSLEAQCSDAVTSANQ